MSHTYTSHPPSINILDLVPARKVRSSCPFVKYMMFCLASVIIQTLGKVQDYVKDKPDFYQSCVTEPMQPQCLILTGFESPAYLL